MNTAPINRDTVMQALADHIGEARAIHGRFLVREIAGDAADLQQGLRTLRTIIVALRREGQHVCGHPLTGYYMAVSEDDINRTCQWLYSRSMTTLQQVAAMKRVSLPDLKGQLRLPE